MHEVIKDMLEMRAERRPSVESAMERYKAAMDGRLKVGRVSKKRELASELKVRIGEQGKWKKKLVKLADSTILVYDHKESLKAKLKYPIKSYRVQSQSHEFKEEAKTKPTLSHFTLSPKSATDESNISSESLQMTEEREIVIEHREMQTLYLKLEDLEGAHKEWYMSFQESAGKSAAQLL
eukprot:TRINITY_DN3510_c0_g3_i11.p2 TRINITY_DN3510_c0_g3~~TRINITY_DN3510_c0_g3_i11.p2  ORF type:complete len:180 (+),score=56.41 TRINITY_DN3510_c0_g3_i11:769-1308(+)